MKLRRFTSSTSNQLPCPICLLVLFTLFYSPCSATCHTIQIFLLLAASLTPSCYHTHYKMTLPHPPRVGTFAEKSQRHVTPRGEPESAVLGEDTLADLRMVVMNSTF
mmetsp:Transcript_56101/g.76529  ORF Transcript_56101/g.76529 Transcript_56101/m.76529 type:complete len:107 (-) Transcript_56101:652-972(-)